jgi:hypothetical protein
MSIVPSSPSSTGGDGCDDSAARIPGDCRRSRALVAVSAAPASSLQRQKTPLEGASVGPVPWDRTLANAASRDV